MYYDPGHRARLQCKVVKFHWFTGVVVEFQPGITIGPALTSRTKDLSDGVPKPR